MSLWLFVCIIRGILLLHYHFAFSCFQDEVLFTLFALRDNVLALSIIFKLHGVNDGLNGGLVQVLCQERLLEAKEQLDAVLLALGEFRWGKVFQITDDVLIKNDL